MYVYIYGHGPETMVSVTCEILFEDSINSVKGTQF